MRITLILIALLFGLGSCSVQKQIAKSAKAAVLDNKALQAAHVGISIYDPTSKQYLYNYQGDKYFVPASNTKIPTCYAAMKYLGDSLVGLKYGYSESKNPWDIVLAIQPTGDPTLFHSDFSNHPVWDFLENHTKDIDRNNFAVLDTVWRDQRWGSGWSWTDYEADYMAERNVMPIFGNIVDVKLNSPEHRDIENPASPQLNKVKLFKTQHSLFDSLLNSETYLVSPDNLLSKSPGVQIRREIDNNKFWIEATPKRFSAIKIPFVTGNEYGFWTNSASVTLKIIADSLKCFFGTLRPRSGDTTFGFNCYDCGTRSLKIKNWYKIHSQPTDSLLKPMMHRSDNFFAEQSLLMVSNEKLGLMSDEKIIDTLLKTDLKDLPQKPRWVDGSGLSRYNLFTPQNLVSILNKMKNEFGMDRLKVIFPTGGEGTISSYYRNMSGSIFGKTGTLSGVVAFSGYLYTKKGRLLIFSTLVNNHQASATDVRRAVEQFLTGIRERY
ncbi:MAG: D-alanyl-D-alanine carboxypeptidase [Chitinophagaceae bacterium]|nr:D-alanyl-D-alanine carboxypeptidase [Chitinophagaceae bacterium]